MTCPSPRDWPVEVEETLRLDGRTFVLVLRCPGVAQTAEPGQFVLLRSGMGRDPFLGRPLAVASVEGDRFTVLCRVVGRGTELLSSTPAATRLMVRGPVGTGFWSARRGAPLPKVVHLVGGGVGIAPLLFARQRLGDAFVGRTVLGVAGQGWEGLSRWAKERVPWLDLYSQDGTLGTGGVALDGLPDELPDDDEIWACGPEGMARALVKRYPGDMDRIRVALESRMACGMGGCLGCVIPTTKGNRRVCSDGPVFTAEEVVWDDLSA